MSRKDERFKITKIKQEFLNNSYDRLQTLLKENICHNSVEIQTLLDKTIKYFLSNDITKNYFKSYIAAGTGDVDYLTKQIIYKYSEDVKDIDEIEIQLKNLFKSIIFKAPIRDDYNYCIKFSIGKKHKCFYIIKNNGRYLLTWGIKYNSVREICNEFKEIDKLS